MEDIKWNLKVQNNLKISWERKTWNTCSSTSLFWQILQYRRITYYRWRIQNLRKTQEIDPHDPSSDGWAEVEGEKVVLPYYG